MGIVRAIPLPIFLFRANTKPRLAQFSKYYSLKTSAGFTATLKLRKPSKSIASKLRNKKKGGYTMKRINN